MIRPAPKATLAIILAFASTALAAPPANKQFSVERPASDNSVEAELASFELRDGFSVNLFASEKDGVVNPISIRWDHRGRLWVLTTLAYPQITPAEEPDDKIYILEDTSGDGRADKTTLFADGLDMPTGFELGHGGVYVAAGSELLHLTDTDGDDRADSRRIHLRGFGTGDTHQNINSFVWGPAGELMFGQGLHCFSRVETPWGIERLDQAGIWRLWPRRQRLDPFLNRAMGPTNPWGTVFDDWGHPFIVSGAGRGIYDLLPGMIRTAHVEKISPIVLKNKLCGVDMIGTAHLPEDLQGKLLVGHFWTNQVDLFELSEKDASFKAVELAPLIQSTHKSFRPVDVRVGPDGAIYIADWFNPIVGHYQASFRHPDRDKTHGRIWRITADDRDPVTRPALDPGDPAQLLEHLRSPERWTRYQARRLLAAADPDKTTTAIDSFVEKLGSPVDPADIHLLVQALGVALSHEHLPVPLLDLLSRSNDYRARAFAARSAGTHGPHLFGPAALSLLGKAVRDPHPRVRLEAVVALSYHPYALSLELAVRALDQPLDPALHYALTQTVHALAPYWKPALGKGYLLFEGRIDHMAYVFEADGGSDLITHIRKLLDSGGLAPASRTVIAKALANIGGPDDLRTLLDNHAGDASLLEELAAIHDRRKLKPSGNLTLSIGTLLDASDPSIRTASIRLAGRWRLQELNGRIETIVLDPNADPTLRAEAVDALARLIGPKASTPIDALLTSKDELPPVLRRAALGALARRDLPLASQRAAEFLATNPPGPGLEAALLPFVSREGGPEALAGALDSIPETTAAAAAQLLNERGRLHPALRDQLATFTATAATLRPYDASWVRALALEATEKGDPTAGAKIYHSPSLACIACHKIDNAGGLLGPDLSGIGRGISTEVIIESLLWPKRQIKEGFLSTSITTKDGRVLNGYLQNEDRDILTIRDIATGEEVTLARGQVKTRTDAGSIMPEGLVASLSREELRDLIAFLTSLRD